jgi:hypothetical protein
MTLKEFIYELENTFSNFAETGDVDRIAIKYWVISCLRKFGKNICDKREAIVTVKNSQAKLPETFKSLILALNLEKHSYEVKDGDKERFIYRERLEQEGYYDWSEQKFVPNCNTKLVTESIIIDNKAINLYYTPEYLSVVKGFKKDSFDVDCLNLHPNIREAYSHQININGNTLQANFKEGKVYVQYNSLPSEEDGEVIIPEITTGDIKAYIENYVKIKIGESLILNNKNPTGVTSLLQMWKADERGLWMGAKSEANFHGLPKDWHKNYNRKLQVEFNKYNLQKRF